MHSILALESSGPRFSVTIFIKGKIVQERMIEEEFAHEKKLASLADELLKKEALNWKDLHAVAVGSGPGSYSGLRIGMALANGISLASGIPMIPIGTLENLAFQLSQQAEQVDFLLSLLPARKDEFFLGIWENGKSVPWFAPAWLSAEELHRVCSGLPADSKIAMNEQKSFEWARGLKMEQFVAFSIFPTATAVARLAHARLEKSPQMEEAAREPDYLKPVYITSKL